MIFKKSDLVDEALSKPWPADRLEYLERCPVCGCNQRKIAVDNAVDNVSFCASGTWKLWSCNACGSAYLNPRPNGTSIHLAYSDYYTHLGEAKKDDYASLSVWRKLRRRLVNGYTNWRYSTSAVPASSIGILVIFVLWPYKLRLDREYRHLPRCPKGGGTLLDVGCGNGSFLKQAHSCGWNIVGVDPDPKAVANGLAQGLEVFLGGIERFVERESAFDVITLNHVIEHVHDPVDLLRRCIRLLKPGGQLWLETPNIKSVGFEVFERNWRGLEAPRHLVLFNSDSLHSALASAGYVAIRQRARPSGVWPLSRASFAIKCGMSPYDQYVAPWSLRWQSARMVLKELMSPKKKELLTFSCQKNSDSG